MSESRRALFPRWLGVVFRAFHLAAVVGLGAALLGAPLDSHAQAMGVLASGAAMMGLDLWMKPLLLREWSGAALLLKLAVVAWMAVDTSLRVPLFWGLLLWSAVFAHAPASFRHARWGGHH